MNTSQKIILCFCAVLAFFILIIDRPQKSSASTSIEAGKSGEKEEGRSAKTEPDGFFGIDEKIGRAEESGTKPAITIEDVEKVLPLPDVLASNKEAIAAYVSKRAEISRGNPLTPLPRPASARSYEKSDQALEFEAKLSRDRLLALGKSLPIQEILAAENLLPRFSPEEQAAFDRWYSEYQTRKQLKAKGWSESEISQSIR